MSMLSAQVDELRELATRYDELQVGAVKAVIMPSDTSSILRKAADTIWQLRDDLQRANDVMQEVEHDESMAWDRVRKVEAENARLRDYVERKRYLHDFGRLVYENTRLRKLAKDMGELLDVLSDCDMVCEHYHDGCIGDCYYVNARRELGVEVDV